MQSSRFWSQRSFSVCCLLYKCHRDCTLSLKSLSTVLTPSSAICPNKRVLSEFSWADHTCPLHRCSDSGSGGSFPAQRVASPFLLFPSPTHDSAERIPRCSSGAQRERNERRSAWHNPSAVYLRRPLYFLSACAASCCFFCTIHTEGRFGCCQRLEPLPLHFVCVTLQHLVFMRLLTIKQEVQR